MNEVLKLQNLSIKSGEKTIIDNLSLSVEQSQILALMGTSGVGKTLAMLALMGLTDERLIITGGAWLQGQALPIGEPDSPLWQVLRGQKIAYIFQDPKHTLNPTRSIKQAFSVLLSAQKYPKSCQKDMTMALLEQAGLTNPKQFLRRYPHELSGGEAQRVAIAMAFVFDPMLIIADEPTSSLDTDNAQGILTLFDGFAGGQTKDGKPRAVIIISHDEAVRGVADKVVVLQEDKRVDYGKPTPAVNHETVLSIKDLSVAYRPSWWSRCVPILQNFHLNIERGQIVGLTGASGVGKTTLAHAITRLDERLVMTGNVWFFGERAYDVLALTGKALQAHRSKVMLMSQDVSGSLNPDLTIAQSLQEAQTAHSPPIGELMTMLGLDDGLLSRYPDELSGGQKARVCLVHILLVCPSLIILDEPTAMLDAQNTAKLLDLLRQINTRFNTAMLIISHDKRVLQALCHRVIELSSKGWSDPSKRWDRSACSSNERVRF